MKFHILVLRLAMVGGFVAAAVVADRGGYVIKSFDVDLTVEESSDLIVQERLVVDFSEPRHGIYRTIPVRYTDPRGYVYSLGFRFLAAIDENGTALGTKVSSQGRYVRVRIGESDRTVQGRVVYILRYRVRRGLGHFAEHDELYWNATGNEWQAPIEAASAKVRLPGAVARDSLEAAGYTGRFGSVEQAVDIEHPEPGVVLYRSRRGLAPLEGLTVVAAWPHGLVRFPGPTRRTARFLFDNWIALFPVGAFVFLLRRYRTQGRDPRGPAAVVVRYEPPPDLSPGEVGALVDERVDLRDITATVVDLAVRGYLLIRVEEKSTLFGLASREETWFERTDLSSDDVRPHERRVLKGLFTSGDVVSAEDLEKRFYKRIPDVKEALWDRLVQRGYFAAKPPTVRQTYILLGVLWGLLTFGVGAGWAWLQGAILPPAIILPAVAGVVVALLFVAFSRAMPRRTRKGVELRSWALGFEEFVDRVERDKLEADRARHVFESLLPYAMALGVAAAWAREFEDIYAQGPPPAWFRGPQPARGFSASSFEHSLSSAMNRAGEGMVAAPRSQGSSGSGGGGFSGGGGGGGGGGSW